METQPWRTGVPSTYQYEVHSVLNCRIVPDSFILAASSTCCSPCRPSSNTPGTMRTHPRGVQEEQPHPVRRITASDPASSGTASSVLLTAVYEYEYGGSGTCEMLRVVLPSSLTLALGGGGTALLVKAHDRALPPSLRFRLLEDIPPG